MEALGRNNLLDSVSNVSISKFIEKIPGINQFYRFDIGLPRVHLDELLDSPLEGLLGHDFMDYAPSKGLIPFRNSIAYAIKKEKNISYSAEEIIVTCGSISGLYCAFKALLNPGDKVLIPSPAWPTYQNLVRMNQGEAVTYELDLNNEYLELNPDSLAKEIPEDIKIIIINNPHNPTGKIYSENSMDKLINYAYEKNIYVFMDEAYNGLEFDRQKGKEAKFYDFPNVVYFRSFSKYFMAPGLRLGYVFGRQNVIENINTINHIVLGNVDKVSQYIGLKLLNGSQERFFRQLERYRNWGNYAMQVFDRTGGRVRLLKPQGTYYLFAEISEAIGVQKLSERLISKYKTLVLPGSMFGSETSGFIRLSLTDKEDKVEQGLRNIAECAMEIPE